MTTDAVVQCWQMYLATLPADSLIRQESYTADQFGDSPRLANELAALIVQGTKTATCSALWEWEAEGNPITPVGEKMVVLDGSGHPVCIIETIAVTTQAYDQVDAEFARAEGEGDLSLAYWRRAHWNFFSRSLVKIGKEPAFDMPLVCERFRIIYTCPDAHAD